MPDTIPHSTFAGVYSQRPPWDIDGPQAPFAALALTGRLLDAGCGSGENALHFAARGLDVTGIDFVEPAIALARAKAAERTLKATFLVRDALTLAAWDERFDHAIDSGLFHVFSDADRATYVRGLETVVKSGGTLHLLCFSDATPGTEGPRRVTRRELEASFARWTIEAIEPRRFEVRPEWQKQLFGEETPHAWFLRAVR
jgi:cyclopropane fatty-acyl-phospholipid synthase-like methyltransferase